MTEVELLQARVAELESAIMDMHAAVPGGDIVDTQWMADTLRLIANSHGVDIPDGRE